MERNLIQIAVIGLPKDDIVYGIFTELVIPHKILPTHFTICPQMTLKWKPEDLKDQCSEVPDLGIGKFALPDAHPLFCVEVEQAIGVMTTLPDPSLLINNCDILTGFLFSSWRSSKGRL